MGARHPWVICGQRGGERHRDGTEHIILGAGAGVARTALAAGAALPGDPARWAAVWPLPRPGRLPAALPVAWGRELLGGNGISLDYQVARFFADAEAFYSYEGTYQMQNLIVGKAVTGISAFV